MYVNYHLKTNHYENYTNGLFCVLCACVRSCVCVCIWAPRCINNIRIHTPPAPLHILSTQFQFQQNNNNWMLLKLIKISILILLWQVIFFLSICVLRVLIFIFALIIIILGEVSLSPFFSFYFALFWWNEYSIISLSLCRTDKHG